MNGHGHPWLAMAGHGFACGDHVLYKLAKADHGRASHDQPKLAKMDWTMTTWVGNFAPVFSLSKSM